MSKLEEYISFLYPGQENHVMQGIHDLFEKYQPAYRQYKWVDQNDVLLITYGDAIQNEAEPSLRVLKKFLDQYLEQDISDVHILPMFPYTSDDGFSITDYRKINADLGDWNDIHALEENYDLMFDAVINHVSVSSRYFQKYLAGDPDYSQFFIEKEEGKNYQNVIRPRTLPLFTKFRKKDGNEVEVWTTFSEDQADLNYHNPEVLLEVLDVLLMYASNGARFIRFDAIGFTWKESGTTCMHLPQTHTLVKVMRAVLDHCFPGCIIITETNVPHEENISYFGNGNDEANMVYQFPLPPLTLYSFVSGDATALNKWFSSLEKTSEHTTYFNFLASHDGIGLRPIENILNASEQEKLVQAVLDRNGQVSYRTLSDGSTKPYELNINYFDAISGNENDQKTAVKKFLASQCILLSIPGIPAIYYHSILGSRNDLEGYRKTGIKRRINREKLNWPQLQKDLSDQTSLRYQVLEGFHEMIQIRKRFDSFNPNGDYTAKIYDERVFSCIRKGKKNIAVLINVSNQNVCLHTDIVGDSCFDGTHYEKTIDLSPYEYQWIEMK
jgi:sucrose phosphorylase